MQFKIISSKRFIVNKLNIEFSEELFIVTDKIFFTLLKKTKAIHISACSKAHDKSIFNIGQGKVKVNIITPATIQFIEQCSWEYLYNKNAEIHFRNIYL